VRPAVNRARRPHRQFLFFFRPGSLPVVERARLSVFVLRPADDPCLHRPRRISIHV
jgi:hypothetical protein